MGGDAYRQPVYHRAVVHYDNLGVYTPDGGEMASGDSKAKTASPTASRIYLNGKELNLTVYLIGGNNFFKLRDLMEAIDVFVGYDNATKAITLDTSKGYEPEGSNTPAPTPTPTTPPPSGGLNAEEQELVGTWSGYYKGFSLYYEFRADGTYSYVTQQDTAMPGHSNWSIWVGRWNRTGNIVSLSQIKYTGWYGRSDCVDALVLNATKPYRINSYGELPWTDVSNDTMSIEMREPDSSFVRRYFINHSVADPTDGYSPRLESNQLPDWLYLGK